MPELPDVEVFKKYVDATALHKRIEAVRAPKSKVMHTTAQALGRQMKGTSFNSSKRIGKLLCIQFNDSGWLVLHFGMTGNLKYYKNEEEAPEHERLRVDFENGYHLGYDCTRMLGQVDMAGDLNTYLEEQAIGPDALEVGLRTFREQLEGRSGTIKSALMNQEIVSGIGNVYSDEILFQAEILPQTKVTDISDRDIGLIFEKMKYVLKKAVQFGIESRKPPQTWLLENRSEDKECPRCDTNLEKLTISGRSSYVCPECQI